MNANGRRARQARNNNSQWSGMGVPRHHKPDSKAQARKNAAAVQRERERAQRKALSGKK